jgi:hypothetical protein
MDRTRFIEGCGFISEFLIRWDKPTSRRPWALEELYQFPFLLGVTLTLL